MISRTQGERSNDAYRFSTTATISDFPLLIGEILRRSDVRFQKRVRRQARIHKIKQIFAFR
jgi:CheY-like chemotaxis protein